MTDEQPILICGELLGEKIITMTEELLNTGRKLSVDFGRPLSLLLIGPNIQEAANEAVSLGADRVYTVDAPLFLESSPDHYVSIICHVSKQIDPFILLLGQTDMGRDIAPRVAARMETSVCLDCVELAVDPAAQSLLLTKPVFGGQAMAVWEAGDYKPYVVTMRPRATSPAEPDPSKKGIIKQISVDIDDSPVRAKLMETAKQETKGIKLEDAKAIVTGGGGIGGKEGFQLIQELAQVLRGAVGISRVPRDKKWMPPNLEIGQTGHTVSPDLYIAVGISGAPQHLAGCSRSKCIIAINKDPEANIFKAADFGVVGDYREVLPPLIKKLKALRDK